ncbi:hypothetical protein [Pandoraea sp. PE-S2T-3]|uniref:hypothetical protein n=1 Tax=Pandoraea sp. PE-S2T-3 TaxID=1986993 RepID=UPI000B403809|nr:hypothetical protein [Pandoraea sp. PE-S2T-3]
MSKVTGSVAVNETGSKRKRALGIYVLALFVGWLIAEAIQMFTGRRSEMHAVLPFGLFFLWATLFAGALFINTLGVLGKLFGGGWARLKGDRYYGEEIPLVSWLREPSGFFAIVLLLTPNTILWLKSAF